MHVLRAHVGEEFKTFPCELCDSRFAVRSFLREHMRSIHKKRMTAYNAAAARRKISQYLARHGPKPPEPVLLADGRHGCGACAKSFAAPDEVRRHVRLTHARNRRERERWFFGGVEPPRSNPTGIRDH